MTRSVAVALLLCGAGVGCERAKSPARSMQVAEVPQVPSAAPVATAGTPAHVAEHHAGEPPSPPPAGPIGFDKMPAFGAKAWCAVSKKPFTVTPSTASSTYKGKVYVFCCPECKPDFDKNPAKYVN